MMKKHNMRYGYYPLIHFFYHLTLSSRLVEIVPIKSSQMQLKMTDRVNLYKNLTKIEKYFFLLETFWVDVNWARLLDKSINRFSITVQEVFSILSEKQPGLPLSIRQMQPRFKLGKSD
jgi:hypothetical protein